MRTEISGRITVLDGWRGLSVLFVVAGHLINRRYSAHPDIDIPNVAGVLSLWGVDLFFVISGYIITRLALREEELRGGFSIRNFYIRRFFRIVPPFFAYLAFVAVATLVGLIDQTSTGTARAATFTCNFPGSNCGWFVGHSWTLAFEEQFYIVFPLLIAGLGMLFRKTMALVFLALIVYPFARYFLHLHGVWQTADVFAPSFSCICVGCIAAIHDHKIRWAVTRYAGIIAAIVTLLLGALLATNASFAFLPGSLGAYVQTAVNNISLPVCFAAIICLTVHRTNYFNRFLDSALLQFLGAISYSLYLWQEAFTAGNHPPGAAGRLICADCG